MLQGKAVSELRRPGSGPRQSGNTDDGSIEEPGPTDPRSGRWAEEVPIHVRITAQTVIAEAEPSSFRRLLFSDCLKFESSISPKKQTSGTD